MCGNSTSSDNGVDESFTPATRRAPSRTTARPPLTAWLAWRPSASNTTVSLVLPRLYSSLGVPFMTLIMPHYFSQCWARHFLGGDASWPAVSLFGDLCTVSRRAAFQAKKLRHDFWVATPLDFIYFFFLCASVALTFAPLCHCSTFCIKGPLLTNLKSPSKPFLLLFVAFVLFFFLFR